MTQDQISLPNTSQNVHSRLFQLDGWRGISILCVLAAHLLPLGPSSWKLNATAGVLGMSLFFTLSGYLITSFLLERPQPVPFLIRRFCRILPLAWTFMLITLAVHLRPPEEWLANFLFYLNYTLYPQPFNSHLWSLCVEMHFYVSVALLVALGGGKSLYLLPIICLVVTGIRVATGTFVSNNTHLRVDEILVGSTIALISQLNWNGQFTWTRFLRPELGIAFLLISCSPFSGSLQYLRPYAGGIAIGSTLIAPEHWFSHALKSKVLLYLATISYALYVIHGPFRAGWFAGSGTMDRYLIKRPLGILITFILAHLSTFYFESYWIQLGKRLTAKPSRDD
jgi:peptidoglycan/LPS O-acetylase OafA/YrhL